MSKRKEKLEAKVSLQRPWSVAVALQILFEPILLLLRHRTTVLLASAFAITSVGFKLFDEAALAKILSTIDSNSNAVRFPDARTERFELTRP